MDDVLHESLFAECVVFVDDILVFGHTLEQHNSNLEWFLAQCHKYNIKLKYKK